MSYVDGFVMAVPAVNKEEFIRHASQFDPLFKEFGAVRVMECWGDAVPEGQVTDFRRAVQAKEDEVVVFAWVEWPDKATRDAGMAKFEQDPRLEEFGPEMPFDGKRMIYGSFTTVFEA